MKSAPHSSSPKRLLAIALFAGLALMPAAARADTLPDAWITTQVKSTLLGVEGIASNGIHVDTMDGRVTLYGTVEGMNQKARAEEIARKVEGTKSVRNLLQVVSKNDKAATAIDDKIIKTNVSYALKNDLALAESRVTVTSVNKGVVLLSGTSKTLSDHVRAIETAHGIDGVRQVASDIKSPSRLEDAEIWRDGLVDSKVIERSAAADMWTTNAVKLRLLVNVETPAFDINVDTIAGVVTLFGVVDSQRTKEVAELEAKKVSSTKSVHNELQVVPEATQAVVAESDANIRTVVRGRLDSNSSLADCRITVEVKKGAVHVTGAVRSQIDRLTTLMLVRTTPGVRGVVDDLRVEPTKVTAR